MDNQLSHELMLMQQSMCNQKYQEFIDDIQDFPHRMNQTFVKPMNKFNRTISKLVKNRGRMLFLLDRRVSRIFNIKS